MLNKEKYIDDLINMALGDNDEFAVNKNTMEIKWCLEMDCKDCLFHDYNDCVYSFEEWLNEEYVFPLISKEEYVLLKNLNDDWKYITKVGYTGDYELLLCVQQPHDIPNSSFFTIGDVLRFPFDGLFQFIKGEKFESYNIQELIDEYEKYYKIEPKTV